MLSQYPTASIVVPTRSSRVGEAIKDRISSFLTVIFKRPSLVKEKVYAVELSRVENISKVFQVKVSRAIAFSEA